MNRRVTARRACHLQVDYSNGSEWRRATAMDMSRSGCRLRLGEELARSEPVSVRFAHTAPDGAAHSARVDGLVVWSRFEGLSYQAGIQFPKESSELMALIAALD